MKHKQTILIVDDVPSNIHMFTNMLKNEYKIIVATNGKKALELSSKESKPDLVLLDIVMPNMDGYEVCTKLKENSYTKDIPVIFISSLNNIEDQEKALEVGGVDFITKPISNKIVKHKIKTYINHSNTDINNPNENIPKKEPTMQVDKKTILVVDDAPQNIQVIVEILKKDYKVSVANSGEKALDLLDNGLVPDLILLDVIMPDMDGYEVCKILKDNKKFKYIPIIFVTILENEKDIIKGLELGAVDYVTKPVEPMVLKARVNTQLKLKEYQSELENDIKIKDELLIKQSKFSMLGEMFENITHQWKQPLSIISMDVNNIQLETELETLSKQELTRYLKDIGQTVQLLSTTIDDFKDFISIKTQKELFNLRSMTDKPANIINSKIKKFGIDIINNIDKDIVIHSYKNLILQVVMNIFNNALEQLVLNDIKNKQIKIGLNNQDENSITFYISDNAGGIDTDKLDKIFDKYYTTKESKGGSGLGLFMSRMIIETKLQGLIKVENKGEGACFYIELPLS